MSRLGLVIVFFSAKMAKKQNKKNIFFRKDPKKGVFWGIFPKFFFLLRTSGNGLKMLHTHQNGPKVTFMWPKMKVQNGYFRKISMFETLVVKVEKICSKKTPDLDVSRPPASSKKN